MNDARTIATRTFGFSLLLAVLMAFTVAPAQAQMDGGGEFKVGPRVTIAVGDISDLGGGFALGGDLRYEFDGAPVMISGAFDFHFVEDFTQSTVVIGPGGVPQQQTTEVSRSVWTVDVNGLYTFPVGGAVSPYAGAGLGITQSSSGDVSNTEIGLNLAGGVEFEAGPVRPFAQGQFTVGGDLTRIGITGGILYAF